MKIHDKQQTNYQSFSWLILIYALFICIVLFFIDSRTQLLKPLHNAMAYFTGSVREIAMLPQHALDSVDNNVKSYQSLVRERDELLESQQKLKTSLLQMLALKEENTRLRELLNSTKVLPSHYTSAEIIRVNQLSQSQDIIVNRGKNQHVQLKQAVLDASGLMGHVVEVFPFQSRILLITDRRHRVPVQVIRNGFRGIVRGTGSANILEMKFPKQGETLKEGDLLVTSGLGGLYPAGYPVGKIKTIEEINSAFCKAIIVPAAHLNTSSHVLLTVNNTLNQEQVEQGEVQ